ncbi:hypothetical protein ACF0H5_006554 [Mactra antiquata]
MVERKSERQKGEMNYKVLHESGKQEYVPLGAPQQREFNRSSDLEEELPVSPNVNRCEMLKEELELLERKERVLMEENEIRQLEERIQESKDRIID